MKNFLLYAATVLIWGSTWLAIEFQLGSIAVEVSLFYRFAIAAVIIWSYALIAKIPLKVKAKDQVFILVFSLFNFSFNYMIFYWAQTYLTSAMNSIAFSTLLIMNIVNTRVFFGKPIAGRVIIGACFGISGIIALFWHDIVTFDITSGSIIGLGLALAGTLTASFGNMISVRNSLHGVTVLQGNVWGMLYGALAMLVVILLGDAQFSLDAGSDYWVSLVYLSLFGTVIAFACYFKLFQTIGPEKTSYVIVLFPLVAVVLSTMFESFTWQLSTVIGFLLVVVGNAIVLTPFQRIKRLLISGPVHSPD